MDRDVASALDSSLDPAPDCPRCPRLVQFRARNRAAEPEWHNAPVPAFGAIEARLLVVGLAPGLKGANRTGRPFTGDYAGDLLYASLARNGFARGTYERRRDDGFELIDCRVTNAVRCVPPENRPTPLEIQACNSFLVGEIAAMTQLRAVLALGSIAHDAVLAAAGERRSRYRFAHGARHKLDGGLLLVDSYHCSRLNTNTGKLTPAMFDAIVASLRRQIDRG
ncbi:MAG: uracil-DNA glycosylase [Pseudomonadota bacterium]